MKQLDEPLEQVLARLKTSRLPSVALGGLFARNATAHKWKATFRSLLLREAIFWRLQDLLEQSFALHQQRHTLGARILLRSSVETLSMLIYLNQLTQNVTNGTLNFHTFSHKTATLLFGSRNEFTPHTSLNINTILAKCAKRYDFIEKLYADLSECAHPNYEGLIMGYSEPDSENRIENFSNRWAYLYFDTHEHGMRLVIHIFEHEYNVVWEREFKKLEGWLVANERELAATKCDPR